VWTAANAEIALKQIDKQPFDLIVTDVRMPGASGLELLRALKARLPEVPVVLITAHEDTRTAVEAMRAGAADFLMKPLRRDDVLRTVRKEWGVSASARASPPPLPQGRDGLLGDSAVMLRVRDELRRAARSQLHVLLHGEPGTGKELAARTLHIESG